MMPGRFGRRDAGAGGDNSDTNPTQFPTVSVTEGQPTEAMLTLAAALADDARTYVRPRFRRKLSVADKPDGTPVTDVDKAVEALLRRRIHAAFPEHGVIGEEEGGERHEAEWVWVIDPIDGTLSFILGKPTFATLIGLMYRNRPVLGVIEHPALGDRWIGAVSRGTSHNGETVRVRPCVGIARAALTTTGPNWFAGDELPAFDRVRQAAWIQHWGADCHSYGLLASGFIDLVIESGHLLHDFCALVPVVEGAGGVMTDWAGRPLGPGSSPRVIAAGDRQTHREALALLAAEKAW